MSKESERLSSGKAANAKSRKRFNSLGNTSESGKEPLHLHGALNLKISIETDRELLSE
jgi:hypothetical protein